MCAALDCSADDPDYGGAHQGVAAAPFVGDEPGAEGSDEGAGGHGGCDLEVKGLVIDRSFVGLAWFVCSATRTPPCMFEFGWLKYSRY